MGADDVEQATRRLGTAVLTEDGIADALTTFAAAHDSAGALLLSLGPDVGHKIVESPSIAVPVTKYLAGDRPKDPRESRVQVGPWRGFAVDYEDFKPEEIAREPYYQEFLRPHG